MSLQIPCLLEIIGDNKVYFPKDMESGGTWIAMGDNSRICCLLNGAFENHVPKPEYAKSRGKLLLESFEFESVHDFFEFCDLNEVAPFTLVIIEMDETPRLFEFRWDSSQKHIKELNPGQAHFWSSATLYNKEVRNQRAQWFEAWLRRSEKVDGESILRFHGSSHGDNPTNDLVMERTNGLQTVSITQVVISNETFSMVYNDLLKDQKTSLTEHFKQYVYA
jgi:hypothetical protein